MKEEIAIKESLKLIEQELKTVADKLQELDTELKNLSEIKSEIKAIKLFLGRVYPDFKERFPDILKKITH